MLPDTVVPSRSGSITCKTSNCADSQKKNSGANAQSRYDLKSKEQLPVYTGGFTEPHGLLKYNDYSKPDVTATPNKPEADLLIPATCSSEICIPKEILSLDTDVTVSTGTQPDNKGSLSGSVGCTTAVLGATASANSGSFDYHTLGNGVKGDIRYSGGCGGGLQNGLHNSGSYAAAVARSLSSSGAHGVGRSFSSSLASAQSSAGVYSIEGKPNIYHTKILLIWLAIPESLWDECKCININFNFFYKPFIVIVWCTEINK